MSASNPFGSKTLAVIVKNPRVEAILTDHIGDKLLLLHVASSKIDELATIDGISLDDADEIHARFRAKHIEPRDEHESVFQCIDRLHGGLANASVYVLIKTDHTVGRRYIEGTEDAMTVLDALCEVLGEEPSIGEFVSFTQNDIKDAVHDLIARKQGGMNAVLTELTGMAVLAEIMRSLGMEFAKEGKPALVKT